MDTALIRQLGDELFDALSERRTLTPLTTRYADITVDDAYAISCSILMLNTYWNTIYYIIYRFI